MFLRYATHRRCFGSGPRHQCLHRSQQQRGRRQTQKDLREYLSNYPAIVEVLGDIADLFEEAMSHFGSSYVVHTAAANFFGFLHGNRHLEGIHLSLAEAMNPPIDYASWLFHRRLQLKEEQHGSLSTHTSVTMRMQFDKQTVVAANASMVARNCVVSDICFRMCYQGFNPASGSMSSGKSWAPTSPHKSG